MLLVLLLLGPGLSLALDCRLDTTNSAWVTCTCRSRRPTARFTWETVADLALERVELAGCSQLEVELLTAPPSAPPHLLITGVDRLLLRLPASAPHLNLTLADVTRAEFRPLPAEAAATGSPALWAVAGSCGAVALLLLAVLAVLLYTRLGPRTGQESKKVSRAESWRYEPSHYIQPVLARPPAPAPAPVPDCVPRPPSLQSTPQLQRGTAGRGRTRHSTAPSASPPAYREPVDCLPASMQRSPARQFSVL